VRQQAGRRPARRALAGSDSRLRIAVEIATTEAGDYVPAGELEVVGAYLDSIGAGAPFSEAAERAALPSIARTDEEQPESG